MKLTQKELIIEYLKEHGKILPAKIAGFVYKGVMFGSETSKRCRELRKKGILTDGKNGRFEVFYLAENYSTSMSTPKPSPRPLTGQNVAPQTLFSVKPIFRNPYES